MAGVDLVRIDGSFPSFSDDDAFILYNEGFTGVSAVARDGSHKQLIFKVASLLGIMAPSSSLFPRCPSLYWGLRSRVRSQQSASSWLHHSCGRAQQACAEAELMLWLAPAGRCLRDERLCV